jgi:signal peptidase I
MRDNLPLLQDAASHAVVAGLLRQGVAVRIRVTGASMGRGLHSGSVVLLAPVSPEAVRLGALVLFHNREGALVLHRVLWRRRTPKGVVLTTKGDGLRGLDPPVHGNAVLGVVRETEWTFFGKTRAARPDCFPFALAAAFTALRQLLGVAARGGLARAARLFRQ